MTRPIVTNPQELEPWLDEFMAAQMEELHIPGVTFSLVQDGELVLAKGYGYANVEQQIPVKADRTLFRVGSVSKLFTATAIMQLVERGLLKIDDDVNKYLSDFQIENNYPQPVTIANLLTHTAGFDDRLIGIFALETCEIEPLGEYLTAKMPARVLPPGKVMSYSNHGYALLGHIVELVTDLSFSQYIDENILQPLEMNHSSFALPSHLTSNVSLGYRYLEKQKTYEVFTFHHVRIPPAGSLSATATDLAKFAIAHLQLGRYKSQRILSETTARQMQQQQFTHDRRLDGICWGFIEFSRNEQRGISHAGGLPGFTSFLGLLPSHNLGFFISNNTKSNIPTKFLEQFFNRYFPRQEDSVSSLRSSEKRQSLKRYQGSYRSDRYAKRTLDKVNILWYSPTRLKVEADGTLSVPKTLKSDRPVYLQEIEPLVLQEKNRPDNYFVAKADDTGKITALLNERGVINKLAWYETNTFHWTLFWCFVLVFLSGLIVSTVTLTKFPGDFQHQLAQLLAGVTCGLNLVCALGMLAIARITKINYRLNLIYGVPKIITLLLCILLISSILSIGLPAFAVLAWLSDEWSLIERLHYSLVALTALGSISFLNYWNLLGFRY